jgi:hypothetical protein
MEITISKNDKGGFTWSLRWILNSNEYKVSIQFAFVD